MMGGIRIRPALAGSAGLMAALTVTGTLAACGSSASSSRPGSASGSRATIPLTMKTLAGALPIVRALAYVRVGGGPTVPVLLDTGSPGLRVLPQALGPQVQMTRQIVQARFNIGVGLIGRRALAPVSIGPLATRYPIGIQVIQGILCAPGRRCSRESVLAGLITASGAKGIMGIDTANVFHQNLYSPLLQLPEPYSDGFYLRLAPQGSGTLTLGAPPAGPGTVTAPLISSTPALYRTGAPAYKRDVRTCWSAGGAGACRITDFDIGTPTTTLSRRALPGAPWVVASGARIMAPGTAVTVRTLSGAVVWQYTANMRYGNGLTVFTPAGGAGFNTGITPFFTHTIGWNMKTGQMVVSPS